MPRTANPRFTNTTDKVLERLQLLPNLRFLNIKGGQATEAAVQAFRSANPNCQVDWTAKPKTS